MQASQDVLHEPLDGCWSIAQPKRHHSKLVKPTWCHKSRLLLLIDIPLPAVTIRMYDECGVCVQTLDKETPSDDHSEQEVLAAAMNPSCHVIMKRSIEWQIQVRAL